MLAVFIGLFASANAKNGLDILVMGDWFVLLNTKTPFNILSTTPQKKKKKAQFRNIHYICT